MNSLSYFKIIKKLPYDKQIEIVENTSRISLTTNIISNLVSNGIGIDGIFSAKFLNDYISHMWDLLLQ